MKIALVSFSTNPSLQHYLINTAKYLSSIGHETLIVGSNITYYNLGTINYIDHILVDTPVRPTIEIKTLAKLSRVFQAKDFLVMKKPNMVHFISPHTWHIVLYYLLKNKLPETKFVHTVHDPEGHKGDRVQLLMKKYNDLIYKKMNAIIYHNKRALDFSKTVSKKYYAPLGELTWLDYRKPLFSKKVLFFGRLNVYKGCEFLPQISEYIRKLDKDIRIIVAGKPSKELSRKILAKMKNCKNIVLRDQFIPEEEVDDLFFDSDVVLIPYKSITQSGVILQAYRHSRPVIAFNIEGMKEFVEENVSGILISPFDLERFAYKVVELINSKTRIESLSKSAWTLGKNRFSLNKMGAHFLDIYKELLSGSE